METPMYHESQKVKHFRWRPTARDFQHHIVLGTIWIFNIAMENNNF